MNPYRKLRVLFICMGNACRSQMAEAFARAHCSDVLEPASAGLRPAGRISQTTRRVFRERNINMAGQFSKGLDAVGLQQMDLVINLCAVELPPVITSAKRQWKIKDPARHEETIHREVAVEVEKHVLNLAEEVRHLKASWSSCLPKLAAAHPSQN